MCRRFAGAWLLPAFLLLAGLALEAWYLRGTQRDAAHACRRPPEARSARRAARSPSRTTGAASSCCSTPACCRQPCGRPPTCDSVKLPPEEELRDPIDLLPLRLGAGRFGVVPARLLGRFALAWWTRDLPQDAPFTVAPDTVPRGARPVAGETAGETPRRLPGVGVELLQLRDYASGDALSRIDWKATARRRTPGVTRIQRGTAPGNPAGDRCRSRQPGARRCTRPPRAVRQRGRETRRARGVDRRPRRAAGVCRANTDRLHCPIAACARWRGCGARSKILESERGESNPWPRRIQRAPACCAIAGWSCGSPISPNQRATKSCMQALKALVPRHQPDRRRAACRRNRAAGAKSRRATGAIRPSHSRRANIISARSCRWPRCAASGIVVLDEPDDKLDKAVLDSYLQLRSRRRI